MVGLLCYNYIACILIKQAVYKVVINANAKINLSLDVTGRLENGYHTVSMIMQEITLCDKLEVNITKTSGINVKVTNSDLPCNEDNIVYKAAKLFLDTINSCDGCKIVLHKSIPVCAGLGGGSADGAAVLKALNKIYNYPLSAQKLLELGLLLGADVPFCIAGGTCHAGGIGEILTPVCSNFKAYVALIKPDVDISTPKAYKAIDSLSVNHPDINKVISALETRNIEMLSTYGGNVFEEVCLPEYPIINDIKKHFTDCGAFFSMMSGSGPTVFGLFDSKDAAQKALCSYTEKGIRSKHICEMV